MRGFKTLSLGLLTWVLLSASSPAEAARMPPRWAWFFYQLRTLQNQQAALSNVPASPAPDPAPVTLPDASQNLIAAPVLTPPTAPVSRPTAPVSRPVAAPSVMLPAASPAPSPVVDAFINMGNGPYPDAGTLTTGGAQPWYDSSAIVSLFGGVPTTAQQSDFSSTVLQRVEKTFHLSGVPVTLTTNPNVPAAHTLSVVSNTTSTWGPVLGLTTLGDSGFSFIDQAAKNAQSVDQLEWIVAHNVAHELMLAFGVPEIHDQSGNTIDSTVGNWSMFTNPNATFSASAAQDLLSRNFLNNSATGSYSTSALAQDLSTASVPEPATCLLWTGLALAGLAIRRRV